MAGVGVVLSSLTARLRLQTRRAREREARTTALYRLSQLPAWLTSFGFAPGDFAGKLIVDVLEHCPGMLAGLPQDSGKLVSIRSTHLRSVHLWGRVTIRRHAGS